MDKPRKIISPQKYAADIMQKIDNRYTVFPIRYESIWKMYLEAQSNFWVAEEIQLDGDLVDWPKLTENEQHFIKNVLAFFAASDGIVAENLAMRFYNDTEIPEARLFYGFQIMMEGIHGITYSLSIDTYIRDPAEKAHLLDAIHTIPCVAKKAEYCLKFIQSEESYAKRLLAFACVEGIFFSGSFCAIFWLNSRGLMPGLCQSNSLISRDEGAHVQFAVLMYKLHFPSHAEGRIPQPEVHDMFREALDIEKGFITDSLPCSLIGINADSMTQYLQMVTDRLLIDLGYDPIYNAKNPFDFMESIAIPQKVSFFERFNTDYMKSMVGDPSAKKGIESINLDDDF